MDINTIRRILHQDPSWSAYALADLQPQFAADCQWTVGRANTAETEQGAGLSLIYKGLDPPVLITVGPPEVLETVLSLAPLPEEVYLHIRQEHYPLVSQWYQPVKDDEGKPCLQAMLRLTLTQPKMALLTPKVGLKRLTIQDESALTALYAQGGPFAPNSFAAYQLQDGVFFGVFDDRRTLMAAGGTHILSRAEKVAAIGNIYTRFDCRRRGYAKAITIAIMRELQTQGFTNIVLSVDQNNLIARTLYETLGFTVHCPFIEGLVRLHQSANMKMKGPSK